MTGMMLAEVVGAMFIATLIRTTFGFGEALVGVPLLALVIPIQVAAPVAVLASIVIAGFIVWRDWRHIHFRSAARLIFSTLLGIPLGLLLLKNASDPVVKIVLAILILSYSVYSLVFSSRRIFLKNDRLAWVFGFIAGIFGGSYGVNGPPLAIYGSLRGWSPDRFRATLQGYFLPASLMGICGYGFAGLLTKPVGTLFISSLPAIIAGIFFGRVASRKMHARQFEYYISFGLILVALILLFQSLGIF
jgi:uncharacterized membrane protein YfcA